MSYCFNDQALEYQYRLRDNEGRALRGANPIECPHGRISTSPEGDWGKITQGSYKSRGDKYCRECGAAL